MYPKIKLDLNNKRSIVKKLMQQYDMQILNRHVCHIKCKIKLNLK